MTLPGNGSVFYSSLKAADTKITTY